MVRVHSLDVSAAKYVAAVSCVMRSSLIRGFEKAALGTLTWIGAAEKVAWCPAEHYHALLMKTIKMQR